MGNKNSPEGQSLVVQNQEINLKHPRLDKATYKRTQNREYLVAHLPITNANDYDEWVHALKDTPANDSHYSLKPLKHNFKKAGMCGNSGTASIQYQNHPFLLTDEIQDRVQAHPTVRLNEPELWFLLYGIADVASKFHRSNEKAGDIRPENIFLCENGKFKVATQHSWPGELSSYNKWKLEGTKTYLSPEEIADVKIGREAPSTFPIASESFSVGLTALTAALLEKGDTIYEKGQFDGERLETLRDGLRKDPVYSQLFKFVVLSLTDQDPVNRVTCQELNEWLKPNEDSILKMEPFSVSALPKNVLRVAETFQVQKKVQKFEQPSLINKLESLPPVANEGAGSISIQETRGNLTWEEIDQKIRKSRQMFPSE